MYGDSLSSNDHAYPLRDNLECFECTFSSSPNCPPCHNIHSHVHSRNHMNPHVLYDGGVDDDKEFFDQGGDESAVWCNLLGREGSLGTCEDLV